MSSAPPTCAVHEAYNPACNACQRAYTAYDHSAIVPETGAANTSLGGPVMVIADKLAEDVDRLVAQGHDPADIACALSMTLAALCYQHTVPAEKATALHAESVNSVYGLNINLNNIDEVK